MSKRIIDGNECSKQTGHNNKSSDTEKKGVIKTVKSSSYMEIYDEDSESVKQIKKEWNNRIDSIKRG